jgi:hypothetical protein
MAGNNICQALPAGVPRPSRAAATAANTAVNVASNQPQSLVGRCRLTLSNPTLKAIMISALEAAI